MIMKKIIVALNMLVLSLGVATSFADAITQSVVILDCSSKISGNKPVTKLTFDIAISEEANGSLTMNVREYSPKGGAPAIYANVDIDRISSPKVGGGTSFVAEDYTIKINFSSKPGVDGKRTAKLLLTETGAQIDTLECVRN